MTKYLFAFIALQCSKLKLIFVGMVSVRLVNN